MSDRRRLLDSELYAHFVTFDCNHRRRLFEEDPPKRILLGALNVQLKTFEATCVGFVVMPEHVHAVVWFPQPNQLSRFMREWKRTSSHGICDWFRKHRPQYFSASEMEGNVWQPKYYPFEIFTQKKLQEKVSYMHENPVKRGLVKRSLDYPWSSARWWQERRSVGVPLGWVE